MNDHKNNSLFTRFCLLFQAKKAAKKIFEEAGRNPAKDKTGKYSKDVLFFTRQLRF